MLSDLKAMSPQDREEVAGASALFAAGALARLAAALHQAGIIDEFLIGELAALADESARLAGGGDEARLLMSVLRAELGAPSRGERLRQAALDEAQDAEDAGDDADDPDKTEAETTATERTT